ncbi:MAG: DUF1501 domain-containing protein [Planctomycetes bacterium]|nr:DUF1501 domain-containing protein [Planctomycetota bacterium]
MPRPTHLPCGRVEAVSDRRRFLQRAGAGFGLLALAHLLNGQGLLAAEEGDAVSPLAPKAPHHSPEARSVIWLFMEGGPSGFDLFDFKPELQKQDGKRIAVETFFGDPGPLMKAPFGFHQAGRSGAWVADIAPHLAGCVDDIAFIKSCHTDSSNHGPAMFQMNTGQTRPGFPSAGAWVSYGLGSENQNLPGFVVLGNAKGSKGAGMNWSAGFLPASYQGMLFRPQGTPILNLNRTSDVAGADQRAQLDLMARLNQGHSASHPGEADLLARIQSFELAYRMQEAAGDLIDLGQESEATRRLYGFEDPEAAVFARKCLLARRMVERGVRFVQVYCDDEWDAHQDIVANHTKMSRQTDQPIAGLLKDLKQRGLLDSTLVVWGGEFGRMPVSEKGKGRDHNPLGFLTWMAGAGVKGGISYGATDEFGLRAVEKPVSVPDLHATILHLLGLDHTQLTYLHNGRRFRLTDVSGDVLFDVLT